MHHQTFCIVMLATAWAAFAKKQFAVNIIFNQWDIIACNQLHQFLFIGIAHAGALRVVEVIIDDATQQYELMHVINAGPDYERVSFAPAPPADPVR